MKLKNVLRKYFNGLCFSYKIFLHKKKMLFLNLNSKHTKYKIPGLDKFDYKKQSNTLFILGSGGSINDLTQMQWNLIKKHDSVGFNNWALHDFVPNFYMFEFDFKKVNNKIVVDEKSTGDILHNFSVKRELYKDVKIIFKMATLAEQNPLPFINNIPKSIIQNMHFSPVVDLVYHDLDTLRKSLKISFKYQDRKKNLVHLHTVASVFDLISFGVKYKFEKIVLVGIDLTTEYFYEADMYRDYPQTKNLRIPNLKKMSTLYNSYEDIKIHATERRDVFNTPISVVLDEMDKIILAPRGIKLYVASKKSKLYPRFPCYFEE